MTLLEEKDQVLKAKQKSYFVSFVFIPLIIICYMINQFQNVNVLSMNGSP